VDSAFAWIGQITEWLGRFIPRRMILDTTEAAIKYKHGAEPVLCGPGVWWYWPWSSTWVAYPTARQTDRLETQTMQTSDGKTFIVSGTLTHEVSDLTLLIPRTHSPMTTIVDIAMAAVHDVLCEMTWEELQAEQRRGTIKTKLRNEAQKQLHDYGIKVIKLQLNSIAPARVLKVCQSVSNEEN
jgi:regulator of protease activity HflC (stomatin/prohibitin superfamily)